MTYSFKGVLLDLDGLLLDTERVQFDVAPAVLRQFGHELEADFLRTLVGVDRKTSIAMIGRQVGSEINYDRLNDAWNTAMLAEMEDDIPLRPGVHTFLDVLDRLELPRAIATNSVTQTARTKLKKAGLLERLGIVVGVDQVKAGKPAPDVYIEAAARLGLSPQDCVALDDSDLGVRAALAAGTRLVIQVPDLAKSRDMVAHFQATSLLHALEHLGI